MNPDACAVLAQIFPLLLVATILEARLIRRNPPGWLVVYASIGLLSCIGGTALAVIGVANNGLDTIAAALVWCAFGFSLALMGFAVFRALLDRAVGDD